MSSNGIIPQPPQPTVTHRASPPLAIDMWREMLHELARVACELGEFTVDDNGNVLMHIDLEPDEAGILGIPDIKTVYIGFGFPDKEPS